MHFRQPRDMAGVRDVELRDAELRAVVKRSAAEGNKNSHHEHAVLVKLFTDDRRYLEDCVYLAEFEWDVKQGRSDMGKGDAVFVNASNDKALVVEVKVLSTVGLQLAIAGTPTVE
jgi:hypothetical protein